MTKPIRKAFSRAFLGGRGCTRKAKRFLGQQHKLHCKYALGNEYASVHSRIDRQLGGGKLHRVNDHNLAFVLRTFRAPKEREAAYVHLLGDLLSDILPEAIRLTIHKMAKRKLEPPNFVVIDGQKRWDIKAESLTALAQGIMCSVTASLSRRNRLK